MSEKLEWCKQPMHPLPDDVIARGGVHGMTKEEFLTIEMMRGLIANPDKVGYDMKVLFRDAQAAVKVFKQHFEKDSAEKEEDSTIPKL